MRFALSKKLFALFAALFCVTLLLGLTVYQTLSTLEKNTEEAQVLSSFMARVRELEVLQSCQIVDAGKPPTARFQSALTDAENLTAKIMAFRERLSSSTATALADLPSYLTYYRNATEELLVAMEKTHRIKIETDAFIPLLFQSAHDLAPEERVKLLELYASMQHNWDSFAFSHDLKLLLPLKTAAAAIRGITSDPAALKLAGDLAASMEQAALLHLAIEDKALFLVKSSARFLDVTSASLREVMNVSATKQRVVKSATFFFIFLSALLTIFFWWWAIRRMRQFIANFEFSINAIRAGNYDYLLPGEQDDELGDAIVYIKEFAVSMQQEIKKREEEITAREKMQQQLVRAQRLESVGLLAGGIAHDFNNMLTGILGYSELALLQVDKDHPVHRFLGNIKEAGMRTSRLVRQLLVFSRKQSFDMRPLDLNMLIQEMVKLLTRIIGEDIVLTVNLAPDLGNIMADASQMEQIIMNLVVNARDAMQGGGRLTIETEQITLDEHYAAQHAGVVPGPHAMVAVSDSGEGISPENQEKIFDPFFSTKEPGKGTGLGLATVFTIVKRHKGHLWFYSEVGEGTTFKVYLPVSEQAVHEEDAKSVAKLSLAGTETILVVDDNETIRQLICDTLIPQGYRPLTATSGEEALRIANEHSGVIALCMIDVIMPGIRGTDLALQLRGKYPNLKIILMSGYSDRVLEQVDLPEDMRSAFMVKPLTPTALLQKTRELLDGGEKLN